NITSTLARAYITNTTHTPYKLSSTVKTSNCNLSAINNGTSSAIDNGASSTCLEAASITHAN
ncbi:hypothetical protein BGZ83_004000, partial [Gryganskiella cystojenkinii]